MLSLVRLLTLVHLVAQPPQPAVPSPARDAEFAHLMPFLTEACLPVRDDASLFPLRAFPHGPLGLEVRNATRPGEVSDLLSFHTGVVGAACGLRGGITEHFHCSGCPERRRQHLRDQLASIKDIKRLFDPLATVRVLSIWAPAGDVRVNDVFVMGGAAREAVPSKTMGFVPSGDWKTWTSLSEYLSSIGVSSDRVDRLVEAMRRTGLSAILRGADRTRFVGAGIGDNESGILFLEQGGKPPELHVPGKDGREFVILEKLENGVYYYETS